MSEGEGEGRRSERLRQGGWGRRPIPWGLVIQSGTSDFFPQSELGAPAGFEKRWDVIGLRF